MEYFKKNSNKAGRPLRAGKRSKQEQRWTLLLIGNHGRTLTLKRFKGIVILSVIVLAVSIGVSAGLFVWNQKIIINNHNLSDDLKSLNERLDALRHDKDILMTRLVLAESRVQESLDRKTERPATDELSKQAQGIPENADASGPVTAKIVKPPAPKQVKPQPSDAPINSELKVAIENFQILSQSDDKRLNILFKIKNDSPNSRKVSGHTIVVLKGDQTSWLPIPWVPLVDGRPTGKQRGHSFGIKYFKTMRLSTQSPQFPEKFETASVYVFTHEGELLQEQRYPVNLPPNKAQDAKPLPGLHAIPTETAPPPLEAPPAPQVTVPPSEDTLIETLQESSQ